MNINIILTTTNLSAAGFTSIPIREYAYLDPGSGSLILQLLLAAILGSLIFLKTFWKKIINLVKRNPDNEQENEGE